MSKNTKQVLKQLRQTQYYDFKKLYKLNYAINFLIGSRGNGKSYSTMITLLEEIVKSGYKDYILFIRRRKSQASQSMIQQMMAALIENNEISRITNGEFNTFHYYKPNMVFANRDPETGKLIKSDKRILTVMTLEETADYKNVQHPNAMWLLFEEFLKLSSEYYYVDEIKRYETIAGTFRRGDRINEKRAFFIGNTEDFICPYFDHFNMEEIDQMKPNTQRVYRTDFETEGKTMEIYLDYTPSLHTLNQAEGVPEDYSHVDPWFLFGKGGKMHVYGDWNLSAYPPFPKQDGELLVTFKELTFLLEYDNYQVHCELHSKDDIIFIHHRQLTYEVDKSNYEVVFTNQFDLSPNVFPSPFLHVPFLEQQYIYDCYKKNKLTYEDRNTGGIVSQYLHECRKV